jgi:hypothetical protein
MSKEGAKLII